MAVLNAVLSAVLSALPCVRACRYHTEHDRWPSIWYDRACIDEKTPDVQASLAALPLIVIGCQASAQGPCWPLLRLLERRGAEGMYEGHGCSR